MINNDLKPQKYYLYTAQRVYVEKKGYYLQIELEFFLKLQ